jgi:hypothetical protein
MPKYLVEVETSTIRLYEVTAKDKTAAEALTLEHHEGMDEVEEHEQTTVRSCRIMPE